MSAEEKSTKPTTEGPSFSGRYGKTSKRQYAADPATAGPNTDFVLPTPDAEKVPGQNFWVMTVVAPEGTRVKCGKTCVKNSGSFNTEVEANKRAEIIRNQDPRFDVSVVNMYELGVVPMPEEFKPFVRKEYTNKQLTNVMMGLEESQKQSKKEMDERMAKDRAKAEAEMRKRYGPDYVMKPKPDTLKEYEKKEEERAEKTNGMSFSQRELVETFAKFIISEKSIEAEAAGQFMRFLEARKMATMAPEGSETIVVSPSATGTEVKDEIEKKEQKD